MKIIYYSPHPTHDIVSEVGYSTHQRETIAAMRALGHEVIPVVLGGTEKANVVEYHEGITQPGWFKKALRAILPLFLLNGLKDFLLMRHDKAAAAKLEEAIIKMKPDLVYERGEYMQDRGTLLCHKLGIKHFLEINSPCVDEMRGFEGHDILHFLGHRKEANKIKHTRHIFAVSSALKEYILGQYHPTAPITVIPNCINPEKPIPTADEIQNLRAEIGFDNGFVFGFVGSIFPHHGIDKLIEAFAAIVVQHPTSKLLIVGGSSLLPSYKDKAKNRLPDGSFVFTGKVPHKDVMRYIGVFDVAVMPDSNWYGSPVKILEYGWMKKMILAPDYGPLRDIMESGKDGVLFGEGVKSLAEAMLQTIEKPQSNQEMGQHFYNKIMHSLTWNKQAEIILNS